MPRAVEAVLEPNGTIRLLEPLEVTGPRRVLVTVLDEPPVAVASDDPIWAALRTAGVEPPRPARTPDEQPLTPEEQAMLDARIPPGRPLSEIIIEEREERY